MDKQANAREREEVGITLRAFSRTGGSRHHMAKIQLDLALFELGARFWIAKMADREGDRIDPATTGIVLDDPYDYEQGTIDAGPEDMPRIAAAALTCSALARRLDDTLETPAIFESAKSDGALDRWLDLAHRLYCEYLPETAQN